MREFPQVSNAQSLAAQETIAMQQKQAAMFSGGSGNGGNGVTPPIMGSNPATQNLANDITGLMVKHDSLSANDYRTGKVGTGGRRRRTRRKKHSRRKKHNKRLTKRRYYK